MPSNINILRTLPRNILYNLLEQYLINKDGNQFIELVVLFGNDPAQFKNEVEAIGGQFENLDYGFGIITISFENISKVDTLQGLQYIEFPKVLSTSNYQSNRASCVQNTWKTYDLSGEGVLVGFLDTGIDFSHPAFKTDSGETRIEYIYDLETNVIYDKAKINEALKAQDPFSVIPIYNISDHGTHVAGIACAGGNINTDFYGPAYKSSIIMVKITREGRVDFAMSTQLMRGLKFLIDKSNELNMPLVVNISLSTNDGAHNGSSLLEQYIGTFTALRRASIVIAAGNEGSSGHHVGGMMITQNIPLNIADGEMGIILQLYKPLLVDLSVEIVAPTGATTGDVPITEDYKERMMAGERIIIYSSGPKPFDINGEITIAIRSLTREITPGEWTIRLKVLNEYTGYFDIWLPVAEGLNPRTRFLRPDTSNTLGIPATVQGVISVGSYNYINNTLSPFSGRGVERVGWIRKPDVLAPGENIVAPIPYGGYDSKSGTSMAAPMVSGISALLIQWGVIKGNDPYLYGERLKYYLNKGSNRTGLSESYPNALFGFGFVCADQSMNLLINRR